MRQVISRVAEDLRAKLSVETPSEGWSFYPRRIGTDERREPASRQVMPYTVPMVQVRDGPLRRLRGVSGLLFS